MYMIFAILLSAIALFALRPEFKRVTASRVQRKQLRKRTRRTYPRS